MRSYSCFAGWNYIRLSPTQVRVWNTAKCVECTHTPNPLAPDLLLHDLTIFEDSDAALNLSHVRLSTTQPPKERAIIPYTEGPILCPYHFSRWIKGEVLPSEEILA